MDDVETRLAALEARVAALEPASASTPEAGDVFWALNGLKERGGGVLYTGAVDVGEERYEWQYGLPADTLLDDDWTGRAQTLAALASPVRLMLLREILGGRRTATDLAELEELGTSGQLYHHLRQLVSAGWLRTTGRGRYTIPAERVVPLLAILTAASR